MRFRGMKEIGELDQIAETRDPDLRRFLRNCRGSKFYEAPVYLATISKAQWHEINDRKLDEIRAVLRHARKGA